MYSEDGFKKATEILDCYRVFSKSDMRFKCITRTLNLLVSPEHNNKIEDKSYYKQLSNSEKEKYILDLLVFVNNLIKSPKELTERCSNRQEFISLRLKDIFKALM